jgi:KDO2-lipid IV(A) lauroyltransferase
MTDRPTLAMRLEAGAVGVLGRLLAALPPQTASNLGGFVAGALGPALPVSRVADANLRAALPALDAAGRRRVARLKQNTAAGPGWEVAGQEVLAALAARGGPAIFFSGHMGNWEILPHAARAHGLPVASLYRAAQNGLVDTLIARWRRSASGEDLLLFPKGARGARQAMAHLRRGGLLAMLVDQKLNDGIEARFFGMAAMTAPAAAAFALHFRCPVIPARADRIGPARLRLVIEPPLALPHSGNRTADVLALTQGINDVLERWIRADPGSWLWLHRRWPKDG